MTQLSGQEFTLLIGAMSAIMTMFPAYRLDLQWFSQSSVQKQMRRIKQYYTEEYCGPSQQKVPLGELVQLISSPEVPVSPVCVLLYLIACTDASFVETRDVQTPFRAERLVPAQV